jgi:hypothetical protein
MKMCADIARTLASGETHTNFSRNVSDLGSLGKFRRSYALPDERFLLP